MLTFARQFNRLRVRTAAVLLILLVPFLILSLIVVDQQRVSALANAQSDALDLTHTIATENINHIESTRLLLTALANLPTVHSLDQDSCSPLFADLLKQYHLFNGIYAVNTATNLGFCASAYPSRQTDNSSSAWYQKLLKTQSFVVSNYRIGAVTGKPGVTVALPVFNPQGKMIAAVGIGLSLEWFSDLLQNIKLPQDTLVVVLDGQGNVLAHNQPVERFTLGKPYDEAAVRKAALENDTGTLELPNGFGVPYFYNYTSLGQEHGDLRVVIGFSEAVLFAPVNEARRNTVLVFICLSIVALTVVWVSSGVLIRPIRQLTSTVQQLAEGKASELSGVQTTIVELKELVSAFGTLIAHIRATNQQQVDDLETVNQHLRREVEERTQAQKRTSLLQALSSDLSEAVTNEQVATSVLKYGVEYLGAASGAFDLLIESEKALKRIATYPEGSNKEDAANPLTLDSALWQSLADNKPVWLSSRKSVLEHIPSFSADGLKGDVMLPVILNKRPIGIISYLFKQPIEKDDDQLQLLQTMISQCAQVFDRVRLGEEAKEGAKIEERHRFARDLHDSMSQTLFSATILAEAIPTQWGKDREKGMKLIEQLVTLNRAVMSEMRSLLLELRPEAVVNTDLKTLYSQLIDSAKGRKSLEAQLEITGAAFPLPAEVHEAFYRIGQECVNNILKHSRASQFWIRLNYLENGVQLSVRDDGHGFDEQTSTSGFGLNNIRERAAAIQATVNIQASPGQGVEVVLAWMPVTEDKAFVGE